MMGKGTGSKKDVINWPQLVDFRRTFAEPHPGRHENYFRDAGIDTYHGIVRFENESTLVVDEQRKQRIEAKYITITTGSKPRKLNIPGEEYLVTSEEFMEMKEFTKRIIFAGVGYISFEFAHIASRERRRGHHTAERRPRIEAFRPGPGLICL